MMKENSDNDIDTIGNHEMIITMVRIMVMEQNKYL